MPNKLLAFCCILTTIFSGAVTNDTELPRHDDSCVDLHPLCPFWKTSLGCDHEKFKPFLQSKCAATCGANCGPDEQRVKLSCVDTSKNCSRWAAKGECKTNVHFMIWKCSGACGYCTENNNPIILWPKDSASLSSDVVHAQLSGAGGLDAIHDADLRHAAHAVGAISPAGDSKPVGGGGGSSGNATTAPPPASVTTAPPSGTVTSAPPSGTGTSAPPAGSATSAAPQSSSTTSKAPSGSTAPTARTTGSSPASAKPDAASQRPQVSSSVDEPAQSSTGEAVVLTNYVDPFLVNAEEREVLTRLFKELDADKSGSIGMADINLVLARHSLSDPQFFGLQEIITDFDGTPRDHEVNEDEFVDSVLNLDSRRLMTKALFAIRTGDIKTVLLEFINLAHTGLKKHGDRIMCEPGFFKAGDHCFQLLSPNVNSYDAAGICSSIGGSLPVFENDSWVAFQSVAKARKLSDDSTFWLNLQPQPGGKWAWSDFVPAETSGWAVGIRPTPINPTDPKCAVSQKIYGVPPSFVEESCLTRSPTIYALCQRPPSFVNVFTSQLNDKFDGAEQISNATLIIPYGNTILQLGVGKSADDLKSISGLLQQLNTLKQENTQLALRFGQDALQSAEPGPPAALTHDITENNACLAAKIPHEKACAPSAGKRKKRGLCNERRKRTVYKFENIDWPVAPKIKYVFDFAAAKHKPTFESAKAAMDFWSKHTCVDFLEVDKTVFELPHVIIARREGCWSSIGRDKKQKITNLPKGLGKAGATENPQILSLGDGCSKFNIAAHEFGHLLGLEHEQARNDRGNFVVINYENIQPDKIYNFARCGECCVDPPGYPYDYGSIMHYSATEFSRGGANAETITDVTPGQIYRNTMGKAWEPSYFDILQVNQQLCKDSCPTGGVCENGGYAHPRDCARCICPAGFAGVKCETFEPGSPLECGGNLLAGEEWQVFTSPGFPGYGLGAGQRCSWIIKAPPNNVVQLKVEEKGFSFPEDCTYGSISVKYQEDLAISGVQYCGRRPPGLLKSKSQTMVVQLRLNSQKNAPSRGFRAQYRFVPKPVQACLSEDEQYPNGKHTWRD